MIADGEEHTIELLAIKKNFTMRVDRGKARSIINDGDRDMLKLTTPLYVGGLPPNVASTALNQWHLRNSTSFHGIKILSVLIFDHPHLIKCCTCQCLIFSFSRLSHNFNHKQQTGGLHKCQTATRSCARLCCHSRRGAGKQRCVRSPDPIYLPH